ncbi:hypothetical protein J1614_011719 [Plenodomus biglobosus]|nr:hypothetical protein J1614_011719 [Plenodomus biglobosus]
MATVEPTVVYDLLILVDATYSMYDYLESLKTSLPKVIAISNLTSSFERIGLLAYRDYSEAGRTSDGLLEWSGWYDRGSEAQDSITAEQLMATASRLEPIGGGDFPEATKTGLAKAHALMREEATTIILLYTDAPPHCWMVADKDHGSNYHAEQIALKIPTLYAGFESQFADWVTACNQLRHGPRKAHVFCLLDQSLNKRPMNSGYYTYLSTITRGACLTLIDSKPHSIAQVTVDVLLAWMEAEKAGVEKSRISAKLMRYKNGQDITRIKDEKDPIANRYFYAHSPPFNVSQQHLKAAAEKRLTEQMQDNIAEVLLDSDILKKFLPKRSTPVANFADRYARDVQYKQLVVDQLRAIIKTDVTSMSLNPVFGSLWRAVCSDRENPARDELLTDFSLHVDRIAKADEKAQMKNWLEGSYDYAADILETLNAVPEAEQYPCVFLDPTIEFAQATNKHEPDDQDADDSDRPLAAFRRDELLEIGRSCDGRILRRLGKVLTQLTYVESASKLPLHIAATTNAQVPRIPLALASAEFKHEFWKILLHAILPGTMLAKRPATLLAALSIRIGLKPLFECASTAMLFWRDKWNNLEVPETWNSSCLSLLPESKRSNDPAPTIECQVCLSKIIWPNEWRGIAPAPFKCTSCVTGRMTIVSVSSSAAQICQENGRTWLLRNDGNTLQEPFTRSIFHTISKAGSEAFLANVQVLPKLDTNLRLTLQGKRIRNQDALIAELKSWVDRRTAEKSLCSLCFNTFAKKSLMPACRRHGCNQQICKGCLNGWYGLNKAGSIINTAALYCPFCRRPPAARTLAAYGMGIHAVGDLRTAVEERGQWIHAWCCGCGKSCQYMERQCARGAPDEIEGWKCENCTLSMLTRARIAEEEAMQTLALVDQLTAEARYEARDAARRRLQEAQQKREALENPTKMCPGCDVASQKVAGCDHMTCPMRRCQTHWCWSCGEAFDEDEIYDHLSDIHGGMYT